MHCQILTFFFFIFLQSLSWFSFGDHTSKLFPTFQLTELKILTLSNNSYITLCFSNIHISQKKRKRFNVIFRTSRTRTDYLRKHKSCCIKRDSQKSYMLCRYPDFFFFRETPIIKSWALRHIRGFFTGLCSFPYDVISS